MRAVTILRLEQSLNAEVLIELIVAGRAKLVRAEQPRKAAMPIVVSPVKPVTDESDVQP